MTHDKTNIPLYQLLGSQSKGAVIVQPRTIDRRDLFLESTMEHIKELDKEQIYYVYEHYKPKGRIPFYVGKGKGNRAYDNKKRNVWWNNIVNKYGYVVRFVKTNLSELDALWTENMCIIGWGRADRGEGPLVNLTDGGDTSVGYVYTDEIRASRSGKNHPNYGTTCAEHSRRMKGNKNPFYKKKHNRKSFENRMRPVRTPLGVFECVLEAAKAHGVEKSTISGKCKSKSLINKNFEYIIVEDYIVSRKV